MIRTRNLHGVALLLSVVIGMVAAGQVCAEQVSPAPRVEYYVAPQGDNGNAGSAAANPCPILSASKT